MTKIFLDFETRSRVDLRKCGMYRYAEDPSTEVLCLAVKVEDEAPRLWAPEEFAHYADQGEIGKNILTDMDVVEIVNGDNEFHAHNAAFERCHWREIMEDRHGFPEIPLERWRCTAAKAAAMALPRSLDAAGDALGLEVRKDKEGQAVMLRLCKPLGRNRKNAGKFESDPELFYKLFAYCLQDVEAEAAIDAVLPDLSPAELEVWRMDQRMNDLGVFVDLPAIREIIAKVKRHEADLLKQIVKLSGGALSSVRQVAATIEFLKGYGLDLPNLQKATVEEALARDDLQPIARRVLELRQSLGRSSIAKYEAMERCACRDSRVRGTLLYHGCSTGRWSAKLIQPQNYPRGELNQKENPLAPEAGLFMLTSGSLEDVRGIYGDPMMVASSVLRQVITAAPGHVLQVGDFSQIEARSLAWLAGEEEVLDVFRSGADPYKKAAAGIFNVLEDEVDDDQRQVGKAAILALGYQGGIAAFATMARNYGVDLQEMVEPVMANASHDERDFSRNIVAEFFRKHKDSSMTEEQALACDLVKSRWRLSRPETVRLWAGVEAAALKAVENPGEAFSYGRIKLGVRDDFLHMRLPSGRLLSFHRPRTKIIKTPWGQLKNMVTTMCQNSMTNKWERRTYYGGLWVQNANQAVARDALAAAMLRLERRGWRLVLSVHDEVGAEVREGARSLADFQACMSEVPRWAHGLPIDVDCWEGKRFRKG